LAALTIKVDELPDAMEVGFAVMVTVGAAGGTTVTVALAEVVPPAPVAAAVYVVVAMGLTVCLPPPAWRVYALPSVPLTVTWPALAALTIKVDELPDAMEVGFAVMVTVGAAAGTTVTVAVAEVVPPAPVAAAV
jgi:hypothetical protein